MTHPKCSIILAATVTSNLSSRLSMAPSYSEENLTYIPMNENIKTILVYSYIWPNPYEDKLKSSLNAFIKTNWKSII